MQAGTHPQAPRPAHRSVCNKRLFSDESSGLRESRTPGEAAEGHRGFHSKSARGTAPGLLLSVSELAVGLTYFTGLTHLLKRY